MESITKRLLPEQTNFMKNCLKYTVHSTLITAYGLAYNEYSGAFQQVIILEELFS
jgi:hypothetical protein